MLLHKPMKEIYWAVEATESVSRMECAPQRVLRTVAFYLFIYLFSVCEGAHEQQKGCACTSRALLLWRHNLQCQRGLSHVVVCARLSQKRSVVVASEGASKDVDFGDLKHKEKETL